MLKRKQEERGDTETRELIEFMFFNPFSISTGMIFRTMELLSGPTRFIRVISFYVKRVSSF